MTAWFVPQIEYVMPRLDRGIHVYRLPPNVDARVKPGDDGFLNQRGSETVR